MRQLKIIDRIQETKALWTHCNRASTVSDRGRKYAGRHDEKKSD